MSCLVENIIKFSKPESFIITNLFDLFMTEQGECFKSERGGLQKESVFNIFTRIFAYFPHFTTFSHVEQMKICLSG